MSELTVIGRAEVADFPALGLVAVPVKVDTGADTSSIWVHEAVEENGHLSVVFFGPESPFYSGDAHVFDPGDYQVTRVSSSFGHKEIRYKIKLSIHVKNRTIQGTFTLSDRSKKLYPVLIGRALLHKKFLVDVSKGKPLRGEEKARQQKLIEELASRNEVE